MSAVPRSVKMPSTVKPGDCWWVPWIFVLGFGVVFMANGGLVYFALRSAPGTVSDRPYDDGLNYNRVLIRAAEQDALGWRGETSFAPTAPGQGRVRPGMIQLTLYDRIGMALSGAEVEVRILRPVGPDEAMVLRLVEQRPGEYATPLVLPQIGRWEVHVTARRGADAFEMAKRIDVR